MEKNTYMSMLYELYKPLLTNTKQNVFEQYYFSDLSLREIGLNNKVSFQAVRDTLKKTESELLDLEKKLKLFYLVNEISEIKKYMSSPDMEIEELKNKIEKLGDY